jgi:hypothetical protein
MALLTDVSTYLASTVTDATLVVGTNLFLGRLPEDPDTCVAIYETMGQSPDDTFGGSTVPVFENPRIQVVARAAAYADSASLAADIWTQLQKVDNETLTSTRYQRIESVQSPFALDRDQRERMVTVCNYQVQKTP